MKISINHKHVESTPRVEKCIDHWVRKIEALLKTYDGDLVHLRGQFEKQSRRTEYNFTVNLSLPTGNLHATASGADPEASAHDAFSELASQIKKHQSRLRKDFEWKRKRGRAERALA
jgi:ribosomal subunit interface protein